MGLVTLVCRDKMLEHFVLSRSGAQEQAVPACSLWFGGCFNSRKFAAFLQSWRPGHGKALPGRVHPPKGTLLSNSWSCCFTVPSTCAGLNMGQLYRGARRRATASRTAQSLFSSCPALPRAGRHHRSCPRQDSG